MHEKMRVSYEFMRSIDQISRYYVVKFVHFELLRTRVYKAIGWFGGARSLLLLPVQK